MAEAAKRRIDVPAAVASDKDAVELMRVWWSGDEPVMAIKPAFGDPRHYGMLLADAARHLARAYATDKGLDERQAFALILDGFKGRATTAHREVDLEAAPGSAE